MLLFELVEYFVDLVDRANLIEGQPDDTALLGDGLQDALTNPPDGVGDKLETSRLVELLGSLDEPHVTLVDEVG